jgi:cell division septation protein DedD
MPEQKEESIPEKSRRQDSPREVQLGGRHLTLAVVGLALFGLILFLLGRWSERAGRGQELPTESVEGVAPTNGDTATDPAAAPKDLSFYDTLGKKATPGFQESKGTSPAKREPPAELPPASSTLPAAPAAKTTQAKEAPRDPSGSSERYRVQVASTRDLASARQLVDRLRKKGYAASIDRTEAADGQVQYKVRIGNFSDRAPAEKIAEKVRSEEKVGAWIVKVQG